MDQNNMELATKKTEVVVIKGKGGRSGVAFNIGRTRVKTFASLIYLGIWINKEGHFRNHIQDDREEYTTS